MRILMFGRGVIATTYGWALENAGHEVEFFVRPGRAEQHGPEVELDILDARNRRGGAHVHERWPIRFRETLEPDDGFDLVLLSVSHHRLADAVEFLAPRIGNATVLIFGNVWAEPSEAFGRLPANQVVWGFPGAGGGFTDAGVLRAAILAGVTVGTLGGPLSERGRAVEELFRSAGFRIREQRDMRGWLFVHFILDAGLHSRGIRAGGLAYLIGKPREFERALLASRQLLPLVQARGVDLSRHRMAALALRMPARAAAGAMSFAIDHAQIARRSLEAHTDPDAEEPRAVVADVLATARQLGVAVPLLEGGTRD